MDLNLLAAASVKLSAAIGSAASLWAIALGDVGMGVLGIAVLTATALINIYSKFQDERRAQHMKDMELSKSSWKGRYERLREEHEGAKQLIEILREELAILKTRKNLLRDHANDSE